MSRKEKFEKNVRLHIAVLSMAGYAPYHAAPIESSVLHFLAEHWEMLISEALHKNRSPEQTAFVLYHIIVKHKVLSDLDPEERILIKECIEKREFDPNKYNSLLARILSFVFSGNAYCASEKMEWGILASAIGEIHDKIFSDESVDIHLHNSPLREAALKKTRDYFIDASHALYKNKALHGEIGG